MSSSFQTYKLSATQKARLDEKIVFCWPAWCCSLAKWIFTAVLAALILCGAVASRMALVAIPLTKSDPDNVFHKESRFLALVVILMVPYGVQFLRCCWLHGFVSGHTWPSWIAVILGIVVSLIEVFGVCYFTIAVLTLKELSSTELILFTNAIFIFSCLKVLNPRERQSLLNILALITLLVNVGGLAWAIYKFPDTKTRAALPGSVLLISIAWFSPLRKWQLKASLQPRTAPYNPSLVTNSSRGPSCSTDRMTEFRDVLLCTPFGREATLVSGILTSAVKLVTVPFVSLFFCYFYHVANIHSVSAYDIGPTMGIYWGYMWVNILCSVGVYLLGYFACSMGLQRQAFAVPLLMVTPVCLFLSSVQWACTSDVIRSSCGYVTGTDYHVLVIAAMLWVGLVCYVFLYIWKPVQVKMASEKDLFLIPYSYSGIFLEQYLFLNREDTFVHRPDITMYPLNQAKVFLSTTMYREHPKIMDRYLRCLSRLCSSQRKYQSLETHIVFDDAFVGKRSLNEHALTFVALCKDILKESDADTAAIVPMPYGSQIVITMEDGTTIYVHFKNSKKVKKGKLWSQVMIMSWIIHTKKDTITDPTNTYFLACDADVAFTQSSLEILLDAMTRKPHVGGATCRVHAEGSGPVVWYQMFEYAVWHWIVKAANSVIGSLLCCSGCFSVFRLQALSEVLPVFSRPTKNGTDYIRKDLGEDRWLSGLLLKSGWLLEYCSLAEVSTWCPETFDEFFQQRRHWIASSFANTCDLIKNFRQIRQFNNRLSVFFFIYLIVTVLFMIISPSVMIWMIVGSFFYITGSSAILLSLGLTFMAIFLIYIAACLFTLPDFHRAFAKGGSYIFSILVFVLALGSVVYVIGHPKITSTPDDPPYHLDKKMGISVSALYLIIYGGALTTAALLHPTEILCCVQALWYFMCLPACNIFLITYSVCNINKSNSELQITDDNVGWYLRLLQYFRKNQDSSGSAKTFCCNICSTVSNLAEAVISEAVPVKEAETLDKCVGDEDNDIPPDDDDDSASEESDEQEDEIVDIGVSEQRRYWKELRSTFLAPYDEQCLEIRKKQLCQIRNGALLMFSLANILWFIVDYGVVLFNPLGFASLTLFTAVVVIQFVAMVYHRLMTIAFELSRATFIPMRSSAESRPQELASLLGTSDVEDQRAPYN